MAKYEIMLLASGKLPASEADNLVNQLKTNIKSDNLDTKYLGIKELAYIINNEKTAHYYLLSFDGAANSFADFHRLVLINKLILRHLIVNLDKDYGARAIKNEKKVRIAKTKETKYDEVMQNPDAARSVQRKAKYERPKKRDEWELVKRFEAGSVSETTSVKKPLVEKVVKKPIASEDHVVQQPKIIEPVKVEPKKVKPEVVQPEPKVEVKKVTPKVPHFKDVEFVKTPIAEVGELPKEKTEKVRIHATPKSIEEVESKIISKKTTTKKTSTNKTTTKKATTSKKVSKK